MERCPGCNARVKEVLICPRCKAELKSIVDAEVAALTWFHKATAYYLDDQVEQSITALNVSISLKNNEITVFFREYLIERQSDKILALLAEKKLLTARQQLYYLRKFIPQNRQLGQLQQFTDYLLAKHRKKLNST